MEYRRHEGSTGSVHRFEDVPAIEWIDGTSLCIELTHAIMESMHVIVEK